MEKLTKIFVSLAALALIFKLVACSLTYFEVRSGKFFEVNLFSANIEATYGLGLGLGISFVLTCSDLLFASVIFFLPITMMPKLAVRRGGDPETIKHIIKWSLCVFAIGGAVYLCVLTGSDAIHDIVMLLSHGAIKTWVWQ